MSCWFRCAVLIVGTLLCDLPASGQEPSYATRIAAWRDQHDFPAIQTYCQQQLERTSLTNAERHALTLELAQAALEQALRTPTAEAADAWRIATEATSGYAERYQGNPRRAQLYLQAALARLAHGEQLLPAAEFDTALEEPARAELREAIKLLRRARESIEAETRAAPISARRDVPPGAIAPLSIEALRSLERNARFTLAKTLRRQAEAYPPASDDRLNAAAQAEALFRELGELEDNDPLAWPGRVQSIACQRLRGDFHTAAQSLAKLADAKMPAETASAYQAERMLVALAAGKTSSALAIARESQVATERTLEEEFAIHRTFLAALRDTKDTASRKELAAEAARRARSIGERWGAAWGDHAARYLARELSSGETVADADAWSQSGDALYRQGKMDEALAAYDTARLAAENDANADAAILLGMKGAAVEQARERFVEAARRLHDLAHRHASHARAADCDLAGIQLLARSADSEVELETWLTEHLAQWPAADSAAQVRLWLAAALEHRRDWRAAVELLAKVPPHDALARDAVQAAARCYDGWLAEAKTTLERRTVADGAIKHLKKYCGQAAELSERPGATLAASHVARWLIDERQQFAEADQLLLANQVKDGGADTALCDAWRIVARAGIPAQRAAALHAIPKLPELPPTAIDSLYASLASLQADDSAGTRELAEVRLAFLTRRLAMRDLTDPRERRNWETRQAIALAETGQRDAALSRLTSLRAVDVEDLVVNAALGRLLGDATDAASHQRALECWRTVERRAPAGTPAWFEAKFELAAALLRLGEADRAAKVIRLTRALHPELGGGVWKARFEQLLARCEHAPPANGANRE